MCLCIYTSCDNILYLGVLSTVLHLVINPINKNMPTVCVNSLTCASSGYFKNRPTVVVAVANHVAIYKNSFINVLLFIYHSLLIYQIIHHYFTNKLADSSTCKYGYYFIILSWRISPLHGVNTHR